MSNYIKDNNNWIKNSRIFVKVNNVWTPYTEAQFSAFTNDKVFFYGGFSGGHQLSIVGPGTITGDSISFVAVYDGSVVPSMACTWSIVSGREYGAIDDSGTLTVATGANQSNITVRVAYSDTTADKTVTVTYASGETTETEVVVDESGNTITTITTTTDNGDGSSTVHQTSTATDEEGNVLESTETSINNNSDGSYNGSSTTYDGNGDPIEAQNVSGDTNGNVSTQGIEYENGEPVVTGYTVDTSENPDGAKTYNGDGANTEYYAFDLTHGFVLHMHFTIDFTAQPAGQDENHHNVLTMKRASPSPWYGFQIRQSSTNKYVQLGTQFSTGSNTNTTINPKWITTNVLGEYDLTITYTPSASTNAFVCYNNLTSANVYRSNNKFPDIDDLKYLKVTIGYAMDPNGDPYRYSNINVMDFSITRV